MYNLIHEAEGRWNAADNSGFWRNFWQLKIPPKVKMFLWRALTNCLPTLTNLKKKFVPVGEICQICNADREITFHILVECPFAKIACQKL